MRKIWGVGPKSAEKFDRQGMRTCGDLQRFALPELVRAHGKWGGRALSALPRPGRPARVEPNQVRKSLSNEWTYPDNLTTLEECQREMEKLVTELERRIALEGARPRHPQGVRESEIRRFHPHHPGMRQPATHA